jgi:triphosphoribosyl-dephospho-CoA synthase
MNPAEAPAGTRRILTAAEIAEAAQLACLLEASAFKPGNVAPGRHFSDARYEDFLASAVAIGVPLAGAGTHGVGETARRAVEATRRWTRSNTNLGIVLLLTPLALAAQTPENEGRRDGTAVPDFSRFRRSVRRILEATSVEDAREVYRAIRTAAPGGLGRVDAQDVSSDPSLTLVEVMRLAADRDAIAREYATAFEMTFGTGAAALARARGAGLSWNDAIVETYLTLLGAAPDTHIERRAGAAAAAGVSRRARAVLAQGGVRSGTGRHAIDEMDRELRDESNTYNPGATADLTAAAIFVLLIEGGWT